jgi:hypothetical protein
MHRFMPHDAGADSTYVLPAVDSGHASCMDCMHSSAAFWQAWQLLWSEVQAKADKHTSAEFARVGAEARTSSTAALASNRKVLLQ